MSRKYSNDLENDATISDKIDSNPKNSISKPQVLYSLYIAVLGNRKWWCSLITKADNCQNYWYSCIP